MRVQVKTPMMSGKEIEIIDNLIEERKPKYILEWGSGGSTMYFPKHKCIKHWLSIEENGHFVDYLKDKVNDKTDVIWADNEWYIDSVKLGKKYDMILVDGKYREECVEQGLQLLRGNGFLLLHDAGRKDYQDFIKKFNGRILIEGEEPYEGFYKHRGLAIF